uniref:Uncharacterized protein n=1 Tax=Vannella robusta TaxID=1487602 RepID=A0A7S4IK20_9EUKA|mmetsp:Transcript_3571/g.4426  ORF Transcript_3571/g.4426 Transcript_3571/m.4426 type:complete len:105 (+) Transcript_3571:149-463(+)
MAKRQLDEKTLQKHQQLTTCFHMLSDALKMIDFDPDRVGHLHKHVFFQSHPTIHEFVDIPLLQILSSSKLQPDPQVAAEITHLLTMKAGLLLDLQWNKKHGRPN